jgi:hypothetical protein
MSLSHCRRHKTRTAAAEAAAVRGPFDTMAGNSTYELHRAQLLQDQIRLKQLQSTQGKAELKRQLLPQYQPYIEGVLSADSGAQDDVLTTLMVWYMDAGSYDLALDCAAYVLEHDLQLPDRFNRTAGCLVAEEIAEAALQAQKTGIGFSSTLLERTRQLTDSHDMPDQARAKLYLALARALLAAESQTIETLQQAITYLKRAIELHGSCGGKKDLESAERALKKLSAPGP